MSQFKNTLVTVACIFTLFLVYTKLFGPIPFSVNSVTTTKSNLFQVDGVGKTTAVPNTAQISLGVTKTASSVLDAQNQTNSAVNNIITDLKKLGIEEKNIQTTNYSVNPENDYSTGKQTVKGYTVTQNLEVKITPIETAQKAVDAATTDGANIIGAIAFILDDKTKLQLEDKARKEAVQKAKEKAQSLAQAAGIKLGRVIDVQENNYNPRFGVQSMALEKQTPQQPTQLTPGENTIQITVTLSYETY